MPLNIRVVGVWKRSLKSTFLKVKGVLTSMSTLGMNGDNSWGIKGRSRKFWWVRPGFSLGGRKKVVMGGIETLPVCLTARKLPAVFRERRLYRCTGKNPEVQSQTLQVLVLLHCSSVFLKKKKKSLVSYICFLSLNRIGCNRIMYMKTFSMVPMIRRY